MKKNLIFTPNHKFSNKTKKSTTKEFVEKARKVHGDKYDYSKTEYVNNKQKVIIICPEHGEFQQRPNNHLRRQGCRKCVGKNNSTTKEFIEKARKIYGDKYDYSKTEYVNNKQKVIIICPEHGEFQQRANNHLNKRACRKCSGSLPFSKIELDFFERLIFNSNFINEKKVYWGKNRRKKIGNFPPDFVYKNCVIEFYGDYWHMNESRFTKDCVHPVTKRTLKQQREYDEEREKFIRKKGYKFLFIWEEEVKNDFNRAIKKAKKFLKENLVSIC